MPLIDSHAHLDFSEFDDDRHAVIARARDAGLVAIVNIGTSVASSRASVTLAEEHDFIYATVGIHPHEAKMADREALDELRALAGHPKVVAIGEIGLDYYRDRSPRPAQQQAFRDQLDLASSLELPVVIHSRQAHDEVFAALHSWDGTGVLHTYAAGPERLDEALDMGFFIGISGPVTFSTAEPLRDVARAVPLDRLLVETDCPYLTPEPHRGKRNEPAYVRHVVEAIAQARSKPVERIADLTTHNARTLLGLP
ncbi:MAG: TatD family hydrolase [Anaerolineae bacterium]